MLGVNGYIFVSAHPKSAQPASSTSIAITRLEEAVSETLYSSQNDEIDAGVLQEIARVCTLVKGLVACGKRVDEDIIVRVYEGAVELEAEEKMLGGVDTGVGAKGVVQAVLQRLDIGG